MKSTHSNVCERMACEWRNITHSLQCVALSLFSCHVFLHADPLKTSLYIIFSSTSRVHAPPPSFLSSLLRVEMHRSPSLQAAVTLRCQPSLALRCPNTVYCFEKRGATGRKECGGSAGVRRLTCTSLQKVCTRRSGISEFRTLNHARLHQRALVSL